MTTPRLCAENPFLALITHSGKTLLVNPPRYKASGVKDPYNIDNFVTLDSLLSTPAVMEGLTWLSGSMDKPGIISYLKKLEPNINPSLWEGFISPLSRKGNKVLFGWIFSSTYNLPQIKNLTRLKSPPELKNLPYIIYRRQKHGGISLLVKALKCSRVNSENFQLKEISRISIPESGEEICLVKVLPLAGGENKR
jgi:hypothetical protein